jgi:hypothetical protein
MNMSSFYSKIGEKLIKYSAFDGGENDVVDLENFVSTSDHCSFMARRWLTPEAQPINLP